MTTFSQLVDALVVETRRPDLRNEIISYLNQTIREMHFEPERNRAVFLRDNLQESQLVASSSTLTWTIPDPATFQGMQAVRYDSVWVDDQPVYAQERLPGRIMNTLRHYFYRAGGQYNFSGFGGLGSMVSLAYWQFPRQLVYYLPTNRPATYDVELGWQYATAVTAPELQAAARFLTSNWILLRWGSVVTEGVRAKIYKRVGDESRQRTCYSLYQQLRLGFVSSESADLNGPN